MSALDARAIDTAGLPTAAFPKVNHEFRVHVAEDAFDRATGRGNSHADREVGGILVGDVCRDEAGPYVRVIATIDALHAEEQGTELTFTHATWEHIHKEMDTLHKGKRIVGWYHTHPGFGVFLSDRDLFIHESFFNLPYQIALVYDPKSREHGLFAWRDGEPRRARRYWIGQREQVWEGAPPPRASTVSAEARMPMAPANPTPAAAEPADRFGLVLTGLVLLLVGGLAGWLLSRWGTVDEIQRIRMEERVAGTGDAIRSLHSELVSLLREAVSSTLPASIDEATASIDRALVALPEGPPAAIEELKAARRRLDTLRGRHEAAGKVLDVLAKEATSAGSDPKAVRETLAVQRALLGQLCAEVAAVTPDKDAARRLLLNAMQVDPGNRETYEKRLRELGK